jgi:hypothetical protein
MRRKAALLGAAGVLVTAACAVLARRWLDVAEVRGTVDGHMHLMAFEFLGGRAHCGRPWHPFGVAHAMVDCPDHGPGVHHYVAADRRVGGQLDTLAQQ